MLTSNALCFKQHQKIKIKILQIQVYRNRHNFLKYTIVSGCKNSMEKDNGQCVPMSECKAFDVFKNKTLTIVERYYLSHFFCGVKNSVTLMCCDLKDVVKNTSIDTNASQIKRNSFFIDFSVLSYVCINATYCDFLFGYVAIG